MDKYKKFGFRTNERIEEYLDELCRITKMKRSEIIRISIAALGELEKEDLEEAIERALKYKLTGLRH
jgi:predicted transcriptional regulator